MKTLVSRYWIGMLLGAVLMSGVSGIPPLLSSHLAVAQEETSATDTPAAEAPPAAAPAEAPAEASTAEAGPDPLEEFRKENDYTINTLIMFICAVLVLFMQAGFAMVEV